MSGATLPPQGPDEIAEAIRRAGKRPPVPEDALARLEAATRAHWQEKVRRRERRWRTPLLAVAALVVLGVGLWLWNERPARKPISPMARVEAITGTVWIEVGDARRELRGGEGVPVGSGLATSESGRVAVRIPTGHSIRLDSGSYVRLRAPSDLALDRGAVYADSGVPRNPRSIVVRTSAGEIRDVGTQFEVRVLRSSVRIRVREGSVSLVGADERHEVSAGGGLEIGNDGTVSRHELTGDGSEWTWVTEVAPMIDVRGRPLREALAWIAREKGWRLSFADADTEKLASDIILEGSIEGLTLDQALDAILATSRLTHRVEQGELRIR